MAQYPAVSSVVLHGRGLYTLDHLKEQTGNLGKQVLAKARELELSPSGAVESTLDRAEEPRKLEPITGHRQM